MEPEIVQIINLSPNLTQIAQIVDYVGPEFQNVNLRGNNILLDYKYVNNFLFSDFPESVQLTGTGDFGQMIQKLKENNLTYIRLLYLLLNGKVFFNNGFERGAVYRLFKSPETHWIGERLRSSYKTLGEDSDFFNQVPKQLMLEQTGSNLNIIKTMIENLGINSKDFSTQTHFNSDKRIIICHSFDEFLEMFGILT